MDLKGTTMKKCIYLLPFLFIFLFSSCISNQNIRSLSTEGRVRMASMKVFRDVELPKESYKIIKEVDGISCKRNLYAAKIVSDSEAISEMKIKAAQLGADAITNIICQRKIGIDWGSNCWESIICIGDAIKIIDPNLIQKNSQAKAILKKSSGTGWIIADGLIVTNYHVVENRTNLSILIHGKDRISVRLLFRDKYNDLAILEAQHQNLPPSIPIGLTGNRIGDPVFTIGYPLTDIMGKEPKMTNGIISALTGIQDDPRVFQITVPLQPGNSGGPLLNLKGEAIGITTSKLNAAKIFEWTGNIPENTNYAVKSGYIRTLISSRDVKTINDYVENKDTDSLSNLFEKLKQSIVIVQAE